MAYDNALLQEDARKAAQSLHAAYVRLRMVQERWLNGPSTSIPNSGATAKWHSFMNVAGGIITDLTQSNNAKLNHVLNISDLQLPGN